MKEIYKDYLFEKHILVSDGETEEKHVFETLFAMAHFFGVKITKGRELVRCEMVKELSKDSEKMFRNHFTGDSHKVSEIFLRKNYCLISLYIILIHTDLEVSMSRDILYLKRTLNVRLFRKIQKYRNL